jgi:hypothetical protein
MSHVSPRSIPSTRSKPVSPRPPQNPEFLQVVYTRRDRPELGVRRGTRGTIVEVFERPHRAYYVELVDSEGRTTSEGAFTADELSTTSQAS